MGTEQSTLVTHGYRLRGLLRPVLSKLLKDVSPEKAQAMYTEYCSGHAADTHQGALSVTSAMFKWARKSRVIIANPFDDVEKVGKKRRRKNQLRIDEGRKLTTWLLQRIDTSDGALGVLIALVLGLRPNEVVRITARDIDDGGKVLIIPKSKTEAGERTVALPAILRGPLMRRAQMRSEQLLPYRPGWVRENTKRACRAAGVPVVCAQALRGCNATYAMNAGMAPEAVASSLGHTSATMTRTAYAVPGAGENARLGRVEERIVSLEQIQPVEDPSKPLLN
jgi:integrase